MSDYKEYLDKKSQDPTYAHTFDLPSIVMPDNGNSMDAEHMKSIGYKYRIESQHVERDHPTAWWWRDMKLFDRVKERIEGKRFAFTSRHPNVVTMETTTIQSLTPQEHLKQRARHFTSLIAFSPMVWWA